MFPLMDAFSDNPWFNAANLIEQVNLQPWTQRKLDEIIPRQVKNSPTANLILEYSNSKIGLVPAKPVNDMNGQIVKRTKQKLVHVDVQGYPQEASISAKQIKSRLRGGKLVGGEALIQESWTEMRGRDSLTSEFLLQGMLEGKALGIDENGGIYPLKDFTDVNTGFGVGPTVHVADWNDADLDFVDEVAEAKLKCQQALGDGIVVDQYAAVMVGPAATGVRRNNSIRKAKFLDDTSWAGSDRIQRVWSIDENVRMVTYSGYDLGGGTTALDLDVRGGGAVNGTVYLVPLAAELFTEVVVPPELLSTLDQPGVPAYSWLKPNVLEPEKEVLLKYWSGKIFYCNRPNAIVKIQRQVKP